MRSKKQVFAIVAAALFLGGTSFVARQSPARVNGERLAANAFETVTETERAFARASLAQGIKRSFLQYAAPDAVIFRPRPVPAVATINGDPDDDQGATLDWWPAMGTISRSHDLAISVGPWVIHDPSPGAARPYRYGYFATVWRKQPDGRWLFVIDGAGAEISVPPTRARDGPVVRLPISQERRRIGADAALAEVRAIERRLSDAARRDAGAVGAYLAPDAWVMGSNVEVVGGRQGWQAELGRRPARAAYQFVGGGASEAADLAYTYGLIESLDPERPIVDATYLRVWQRRAGAWRIIFDGVKSRRRR